MTDNEFMYLMEDLRAYLRMPKTFILNPARVRELNYAKTLAHAMFPDAEIKTEDDPLQTGAMILRFTVDDIICATEEEYASFVELVSLTDNFEIYSVSESKVCFAATFHNCLARID